VTGQSVEAGSVNSSAGDELNRDNHSITFYPPIPLIARPRLILRPSTPSHYGTDVLTLVSLKSTRMGFAFPKINSRCPGSQLPARYYLLILVLFLCLHLILSNIHESYGRATSLSNITPAWFLEHDSCSGSSCSSASSTMKDHWPHPWHLPQTGRFDHQSVFMTDG
jgi:hypothetical protein